jgi:multiple sugar transport system substrate-binding protein
MDHPTSLISRRSLLKAAGAVGAAATLQGALFRPLLAQSAPALSGPVSYWHHYAGNDALDGAINKVFDAFRAAYPDIEFTPDAVPNPDYMAKVTTASQTDTLPDALLLAQSRFADAYGMGSLVDITDRIKALPTYADFPETLFAQEEADGRWYGLPAQVFPDGNLFYRKDWLEEAGFTAPPTTWDEFQEIALAINDPANNRYGFGMRGGDLFAAATLLSVIDSWGSDIIDAEGKPALDRDISIEAVMYYSELHTKHGVVPPSVTSDGYSQLLAAFETGQTGLLILGYGALSGIQTDATFPMEALGVDIAPGKVRPAVWQEALCNAMTSDRNADATWAWISFWADPDIQASFYADTGFLPSMNSAYEDPRVSESPFIEAGQKAIQVGRPSPSFPGYTGYITDLTASFQAVLTGSMTPTEWTDDAISRLNALLA